MLLVEQLCQDKLEFHFQILMIYALMKINDAVRILKLQNFYDSSLKLSEKSKNDA